MNVSHHKYFLSCDWGTSRFRLFLIDGHTSRIIHTIIDDKGLKFTIEEVGNDVRKRRKFIKKYLKSQIDRMAQMTGISLDNVWVVASGMLSSSIGLIEVPYTNIPVELINPAIQYEILESDRELPNPMVIIGGLRTEDDVIRGEETIIIGLREKLLSEKCISILPGTHSKHVFIEDGSIKNFKTYMTGELFEIISRYSILAHSVSPVIIEDENTFAFEEGVHYAQNSNIINSLFKVRTKEILNKTSPEENYAFLSGLLIGCEIKEIHGWDGRIYVCGDSELTDLYIQAIKNCGRTDDVFKVSGSELHMAFCDAHRYFWQSMEINTINKQ